MTFQIYLDYEDYEMLKANLNIYNRIKLKVIEHLDKGANAICKLYVKSRKRPKFCC